MTTIKKVIPTALVKLETAEGVNFNLEIEITELVRKEAKVLTGAIEERLSIYRMADKIETIFGEGLAKEFMLGWCEGNYSDSVVSSCGLYGAFVFAMSRQGSDFWVGVSKALESIIEA